MKLLKEDEELVSRITRLLETHRADKTLSLDDVPLSDVQRLLASDTPDLAMFGSYVLSMLPDNLDLTVVKENLASARNYARFLIAEKPLASARNIGMQYNIFSTGDIVQTPLGTLPNRRGEGRTLSDGITMINQIVTDDGQGGSPGHAELHEPETWRANHLEGLLR